MKLSSFKRVGALWWMVPLFAGLISFALVYGINPSSMIYWRVRAYAANSIAVCLLAHAVVTVWLFIGKNWRKGFMALVVSPIFIVIVFVAALMVGPDLESVVAKVSALTHVPQDEIKCRGGSLHREPSLVFELPRNSMIVGNDAEVVDLNDVLTHLKAVSDLLNIQIPMNCKVLRFRLEFDTVFVVCDAGNRLVFFLGNAII